MYFCVTFIFFLAKGSCYKEKLKKAIELVSQYNEEIENHINKSMECKRSLMSTLYVKNFNAVVFERYETCLIMVGCKLKKLIANLQFVEQRLQNELEMENSLLNHLYVAGKSAKIWRLIFVRL